MLSLVTLGTPNPGSPHDVPITLALIGVTLVGYLIHCQREHVRRKVAARRLPRR